MVYPLALTVLLTSRFVLSGSSARSCFFCFSAPFSVRPVTVGFYHYTCHSGLAADGSASRSDLRAASPAPLLLPLLRLVPPWWSNHLCGRGICPSLTARGSTVIICCPNKHPLYPHLNPASPSWHMLSPIQNVKKSQLFFVYFVCAGCRTNGCLLGL